MILSKVEIIYKEINKLYDDLSRHQDRCKHIKATKRYNRQWEEFRCPVCLKGWREESDMRNFL